MPAPGTARLALATAVGVLAIALSGCAGGEDATPASAEASGGLVSQVVAHFKAQDDEIEATQHRRAEEEREERGESHREAREVEEARQGSEEEEEGQAAGEGGAEAPAPGEEG